MIEIKRMFHKKTGEIVFEDVNGDWWMQEYLNFDIELGIGKEKEWSPVVATKIENPLI